MAPLPGFSVSLWAPLVFCALLKHSQPQSFYQCDDNQMLNLTTATTTVTLVPTTNCTLNVGNATLENGTLTNLTPGTSYVINLNCSNCTQLQNFTTKPEIVKGLSVTDFSTSYVFLNWTEPVGNSSFYIVQWTDGNVSQNLSVTETHVNISGLTAGVQYTFSVMAVAGDNETLSNVTQISQYTKPEVVRNLIVTEITTSSVFLNWTEPVGNSSFYIVQWTDGNVSQNLSVTETHVNISGLTAGVQYTFNVIAVAGDNQSQSEATQISHYTKPEVVQNLTVTEITTSSVLLNWTEAEGNCAFYTVQWTNETDSWSINVTETHVNISGLTAGVQYTFSVIAVAGDNQSQSEVTQISQYTKPEVVRNLIVTEITTSSVFLNWTEPVGNSSFYIVQWTDGNVSQNLNVTETHVNISGLTAGVQYTFSVIAVAGDNQSQSEKMTQISHYTKPEVVQNLTVTEITTSSVLLNWTEAEGNCAFYTVQWTNETDSWSINVTETHVNISGLTAGVQYTFSVIAVAGDNQSQSEVTQISQYTKPEVVRNLIVTEITTSSVFLNWTEPVGNSSFYIVQWTDGNVSQNLSVTETHVNISGLTAGVQYAFSVIAVAGDNQSQSEVTQISHYTKPEVVQNLTVTEITTSSVLLNWTEAEGNCAFYTVQWTNETDSWSINVTETHVNISGLTAGVQYTFSVMAVAGDNETLSNVTQISQYTRPGIIRNLSSSQSVSTISLSWDPPLGQVFLYSITWNNGGASTTTTTNSNSTVLSNLTSGTNYTITITAVAGDNKTQGDPYTSALFTKPAVARNLTVTEITTSSVFLNWTEPVGNSSFYIIQWTDGNVSQNLSVTETHVNISGLTAGVQYTFNVIAVAGDNQSQSEVTQISHYTKPEVVQNLTVTEITTSSVLLNWTEAEGNCAFYTVQWTNETDSWSINVTETHVNISGLTAGVQYTFNVIAVAGDNQTLSNVTQISQYTRPGIIRNLSSSQSVSTISLSWDPPSGQVFLYSVTWNNGGASTTTTTNSNSTVLSNLTSGTNYTITITAVAGDNKTQGDPYTSALFTKPAVVRNLSVTKITTSSVFLNWTEPVGNSSFYIVQWTNGNVSQNLSVTETHVNISGLTAGVQYTFSVIAVAGDNQSQSEKMQISHYTKPAVVRNLTVTKITTSSVFLNWTEPVGNSSFYIIQWTDGNVSQNLSVTETHVNISGLTAGVQYTFNVIAVAGDNQSQSEVTQISHYTKPAAVRNLTVTKITTSSVFLNWTEPVGNSSFYIVQWTDGNVSQNLSVTATHVNISGLTAGVQYAFSVIAVAGDNQSQSEKMQISHYTKPAVVRNLSVTKITTSSVFLNWTEPVGNSSFYIVQWTNGNVSQNLSVTETHVNISGLTAGVQYTFSVIAVAGDNQSQSEKMQISHYTKPEVVRNLTVTEITTSSVFLNWTEPVGNSSFYIVQWTNGNVSQNLSVTETHVNISGLTAGVQYAFNVIAVAGDNQSQSEKMQISHYTKPAVVRNLTVTEITTSSVFLNWTEPVGNSSFYIVQWTDGNVSQNLSVTETHVNISGLTAGVQYTFSVIAVAGDNQSQSEKMQISHYTKPAVVRNLTVTEVTTSSVFLNWTEPVGNSSFYIIQWTDGNVSQNLNVTETHVNISGLTAGVQYTFSVIAVAGDNQSQSEVTQISQYTKPAAVRNLTVTKITTSSVFLNWTEPVGSSSFYIVQWTDGNVSQNLSVTETHVNISGLTAGVQYTFSVIAVAGDNQSQSEKMQISHYTRPGIIRNLNSSQSVSTISLSWNPPSGQVFLYSVTWNNGGASTTTTTNSNSTVLSNLTSGTNYTITITAVAGDNKTQGDPYTSALFTKPEVVRNLTVTEITTSSVFLNWTEPVGNSSFYIVQWTDGNVSQNLNVTETHVNISGLTAGVQYTFIVIAVAGDNQTLSNVTQISQYTKPGIIRNLNSSQSVSTISLSWNPPSGQVFLYSVTWNNGGASTTTTTNSNSTVLSNLTSGTNYTITITAVAGDNKTQGDPYTSALFTKPDIIRNLNSSQSVSTISLSWDPPLGQVFLYSVTWNNGGASTTTTTNSNSTVLSNLTSGTNYTITITAVAGDNKTQGDPYTSALFTRPEKPQTIMITAQGTYNLGINWTLPSGRVDYYMANISDINQKYLFSNTTQVTAASFSALYPGRVHVITVTAVAGSFTNTSDQSNFATVPTPTAYIIISQATNSSLSLQWPTPNLMDGAPNISYYITYQSQGGDVQSTNSTVNSTDLLLLSSGTLYNITVTTAGPKNLRSTVVSNSSYTLPNPVLNLRASPQSTTSITVTWSNPVGYLPYYGYLVKIYQNTTLDVYTTLNTTIVSNLEPGTGYNISVITTAANISASTAVQTFSYTMPGAVTGFTVSDVNTTAIQLTWVNPSDYKPTYSYTVIAFDGTVVVQTGSTNTKTYTFINLIPGKLYTFNVLTVLQGINSTVQNTSSYTRPDVVSNIIAIGSTTNMSVSWTPAVGQVFSYRVQLNRNDSATFQASNMSVNSTTVNTMFANLTQGVLYCVVVVSISGPYESNSSPVCNATFPNSPGSITVSSQTVSSINFTWSNPVGMDYALYTFTVFINDSFVNTTNNNWYQPGGLQPGTLYKISVATVGVLNYTSTAVTAQNYTRPYSVTQLQLTQITTNAVTLNWEQPENQSYSYSVQATNGSFSMLYKVSNTTYTIIGLLSGSNYNCTVTAETADGTQAAPVTIPCFTRPYSVTGVGAVALNTTAVNLSWIQPLEYKNTYSYRIETTGCGSQNTTLVGNVAVISGLNPGTNCTFCVYVRATNGTEGAPQCVSQYTRPLSVNSLIAVPTVDSITVSWAKSVNNTEMYNYILTWQGNNGSVNKTTNNTSFTIYNLDPGSAYNFSVTTVTADGTLSTPTWNSSCTNASPVYNQSCQGPNGTDAKIILSWAKPIGQNSGFLVTVNSMAGAVITQMTRPCCNQIVSGLNYNQQYNVTVVTQSCGQSSTPVSFFCWTGITNPTIPNDYELLASVTDMVYNQFTVQIQFNLLKSSSGPVTNVGMLVTNNPNSLIQTNQSLKQFLNVTYDQWISSGSPVYLATVKDFTIQSRSAVDYLTIKVGDASQWNGYNNGALSPKTKYQYAIALFTSLQLQGQLVNVVDSLVSVTPLYPAIELPENPAVITAIAAGVTVGIFFVIFIILIGVIFYWRRSHKKEPDINIQPMRSKVSVAIRVEDYEAYYKKQRADSNCGFAEEFEDMKPVGTNQSKTNALTLENKPKNRYNNVLPYDSSRVKLSIIHGDPHDDYINANYMPGYNSRKEFIAAQGPLPSTVKDFWRMVWEKNVYTLVMLTRCNEQGRVKCEQYWGPGTKHYENFTVTTISDVPLDDWTIRDFRIKNLKTAETRSVRHFHFTAWPDHGVPETTELLINFRHLVREHMDQYSRHSPTVVHCSAGVGRTGTFIAIDHLMYQIEGENIVDVFGIVHDLRMHRPLMVQTEDQYVFLNQCALDIIRSRTGNNVDLIYQNAAALSIYENVEPKKGYSKNGHYNT
ncbi:receptor-type tyrosine-protein phosphatase beta-like isoform X9 [Anabas testudineus]|uniref:receptor-type tyrosine-protein phosphatase beta-like isoform X9 n=1 Tax=Anabas testudineus TaxID=64144 RepID=UPI000E462618|nr:receptor-type tyrosine-protein phosphatase beta-like isoform X9 [Anabas testudineus]